MAEFEKIFIYIYNIFVLNKFIINLILIIKAILIKNFIIPENAERKILIYYFLFNDFVPFWFEILNIYIEFLLYFWRINSDKKLGAF